MQTLELIEVTGKSAEKFFQLKKSGRSIRIQPLTSLLPKVSPIHDLQMTTKRLQRADRIYAVANLVAVTTLATSLSTHLSRASASFETPEFLRRELRSRGQ